MDFVLEEYNRNIKKYVFGVVNSVKWEMVIKNYECFEIMLENVEKLIYLSIKKNLVKID